MFKLVKILNAPSNNPDAFYLATNGDVSYAAGTPVHIDEDGLPANCTATDVPEYLVLEDAPAGGKTKMLAIRILPNMVFETTAGAALNGLTVGCRVQLHIKSGKAIGVTGTTTSGVATLYRIDGTAADSRVLVTF